MLSLLKEYITNWLLMQAEKKIRKLNQKLKIEHAKYYEKTGKWTPLDDEHEDY